MRTILIELLPLIIGAALLPLWIVMSLLLLRGAGGMSKATAFAAGAMAVRVLQGIFFGYVFGTAADANGYQGSSVVASTLLLVVGVVLLVTAVRQWHKDDDPDAPPPPWMATLGTASSLKAFGIGALLMTIAVKQWVFTLAAIAVLDDAQMGLARSAVAYVVFVVAAHALVLMPIVIAVLAPSRSAAMLDAMRGWLERHNRMITLCVSSIFGAWFAWKGTMGLLG
jgi:hypothetical protein